jgi:hypothetical protein
MGFISYYSKIYSFVAIVYILWISFICRLIHLVLSMYKYTD